MLSPETNTAVIGRLRIRSKSPDPRAEQERIARMLSLATLHPAGLPPSSLLVVRRMADPLPQRLRAGRFDAHVDAAWERAATSELGRLAASAARPALGMAAAEASAVLFSDRAELLAALALDWMVGALAEHWWWRELFRGRDLVSALLMEWSSVPQYVPAAVEILAARGRAVTFLQCMPPQAAEAILEGVISAFQLPRPGLFEQENSGTGMQRAAATGGKEHTAAATSVAPQMTANLRQPWAAWVPEACTPALQPLQKLLFAQAMMLRRAPATARSVRFQQEVQQWRIQEEDAASLPSHPHAGLVRDKKAELPADQEDPRTLLTNVAEAPHENEASPMKIEGPAPVVHSAAERRRALNEDAPEIRRSNQQVDRVIAATENKTDRLPPAESSVAQAPAEVLDLSSSTEQQTADVKAVSEQQDLDAAAQRIETDFGGVFFLLNLALFLNIYADFTQPKGPGLELSPWDFIALLGSELTEGSLEKDPLWAALARLAGRAWNDPPGSSFVAPEIWRLPPEWLEPFPEDFARLPVAKDDRLICLHPAGFTVLDLPIAPEAREAQTESPADSPAAGLRRWTGWMSGYIRARLARAVGRNDAVAICLRQAAQATLRATHVDVTFSLNRHPIELRMAGLDRDPGWIPAAGCYVAFHFK